MGAADAEQIDVSGDGGVLKQILTTGTGAEDDKPFPGSNVSVHYVGTLAEDGSQFDSSRDRGEKFQFQLGQGQVIKAWDLGVATMRRGEVARFTCKSDYAYGAAGSPPKIPAGATLVFEVELFDWRGEDLSKDQDGSILRRTIDKGSGLDTPNDGSTVTVELHGVYDGRVFDERQLTFCLGEGDEHHVCPGVELALEKFKSGEKSELTLSASQAFGLSGSEHFKIAPNSAPIVYQVTLSSFEKVKNRWEYDQQGKLDQAQLFKEKGTKFFKEEKLNHAIKQYKKAIEFLQYETEWNDEQKTVVNQIQLAAQLNLALCCLKVGDTASARSHCDEALGLDSGCVKALFRRGQALLAEREPELARVDFGRVLELEPSNAAAAKQLQLCSQMIQKQLQQDRQRFSNMFARMQKLEEKERAANPQSEIEIDHFANGDGDKSNGDIAEDKSNGDISEEKSTPAPPETEPEAVSA